MTQRDPGVYLEDIEYYANAAVRFMSGYNLDQYLADEKTRAAVERVLEICGEAMNNLHKICPVHRGRHSALARYHRIRNILAHGYAELDHSKVYDIAVRHAPELLVAVRSALKAFPDPAS